MNAPSPTQPTLLFIPDISGFTEFVSSTEISHSQHIIEELLEVLIDANEMDLVVSEIEGDAVLFYREGPVPTAVELLVQVQRMYVRFHTHLRRYDTHRICHCGACSTASGLTLKFVMHHGEVTKNRIRSHTKLFGKDVIVAHRLLKNAVPHDEYALITRELIHACPSWVEVDQAAWAEVEESSESYDVGPVRFCVIPLRPLRDQVPEPLVQDYGLPGLTMNVQSFECRVAAPLDLVFDVVSDLSSRHLWQADLKGSDRLSHKIPQHGAQHRCVREDSEKDPFIVSHDFGMADGKITFTDTEPRQGWALVFQLSEAEPGTTRIQQHLFLKKSVFLGLVFRLFLRKKQARWFSRSCRNLEAYCQELLREGRRHPATIVLAPSTSSDWGGSD